MLAGLSMEDLELDKRRVVFPNPVSSPLSVFNRHELPGLRRPFPFPMDYEHAPPKS